MALLRKPLSGLANRRLQPGTLNKWKVIYQLFVAL
jgi:hypothetical protein